MVAELTPLRGAQVTGVWVHAERALTLEFYGRGGGALLLLSAEPDLARLHVARRRPAQPETALAFQIVLRREVEGARLAAIERLPGDRVVTLQLERGPTQVKLVAELTGRHGNLILVGGDGIIRASASRSFSPRRWLLPGQLYLPPDRPSDAEGIRDEPPPQPPRLRAAPATAEVPFPISATVEALYEQREQERRLLEARRRLREPLRAALARSVRAVEKVAEEAKRVPAADEDRRRADLLKASLRSVGRGQGEVLLTEWTEEGAREVRVALESRPLAAGQHGAVLPALSPNRG